MSDGTTAQLSMGGTLADGGFGVQSFSRAAGHLGPIREEMGVDEGGGRVKKRTDGGDRTRQSGGQSDKERRR